MLKNNTSKIALVTGAGTGIGRCYALQLSEKGYGLILVGNYAETLENVAYEIQEKFGTTVFVRVQDLSTPDAAQELILFCENQHFDIEILINNAGVFYYKEVVDCKESEMQNMLQLHVVTYSLLCRHFAQKMKKKRLGYILNMSSLTVWTPFPGVAHYAATKGFLLTFSRALHNELYDYNVNVTAVCPGGIATDLYGLPQNLKNLGVKLHILMTPERLAKKALKALFRNRIKVMPGSINILFKYLCLILPSCLVRQIRKFLIKKKFYSPVETSE